MYEYNNKTKNLILLTNIFPYGSIEPYLETEVKYYEAYFDNIFVCSLQVRRNDLNFCRKLPSNKFKVLPILKASNIVYLINALFVIGDKNLYRELIKLHREHRLNFRNIVQLFVYLNRANYEAEKIRNWLKSEGVLQGKGEGALYAYRFEYQPYISLILKRDLPQIKVMTSILP